MKKLLGILVMSGVVLAGCSQSTPAGGSDSAAGSAAGVPAAADKQGDTSKTGAISEAGGRFFIQPTGGQSEEIESYNVDLGEYVGQTVTVTGQFSGDTLFVATVE